MDAGIYAAIAAIVAPVVTALINNRHQYKMRKIEMVQEEKIKAIQEYAEACGNYMALNNGSVRSAYYKSYGKIFLYSEKKHWKSIEEIHQNIENGNFTAAAEKLPHVCQSLAGDMRI